LSCLVFGFFCQCIWWSKNVIEYRRGNQKRTTDISAGGILVQMVSSAMQVVCVLALTWYIYPILVHKTHFRNNLLFGSSLVVCGERISYLRYLCLFVYSGVQHILCCVFVFCFSSSCVPYIASYYGLSFFDYPFGINNLHQIRWKSKDGPWTNQ
jgi:hypothetical protein